MFASMPYSHWCWVHQNDPYAVLQPGIPTQTMDSCSAPFRSLDTGLV